MLWAQLARVYVSVQRYDLAIKGAYGRLLDLGGRDGAQDAGLHNQLGIAHYLKGEREQAAFLFKQAVALAPRSQGLQRNLALALAALGKAQRPAGEPVLTDAVDEGKAGAAQVDEDSFAWE